VREDKIERIKNELKNGLTKWILFDRYYGC